MKMYAEDFAALTSPEINDTIDQHFAPHTAKFLKEQWALVAVAFVARKTLYVENADLLEPRSFCD